MVVRERNCEFSERERERECRLRDLRIKRNFGRENEGCLGERASGRERRLREIKREMNERENRENLGGRERM